MTIKKQFIILAAIIVTIPILCSAFVLIQHYVRSSERFLMDGTKQIKRFDSKDISKKDLHSLFETLRILPPDVEACAFTKDEKIVFTSIPEIPISSNPDTKKIWEYIGQSSDRFFYQFTTIDLDQEEVVLVTRIRRNKDMGKKPVDVISVLIIFLFVIVTICVFFIIAISKTIFNSIVKIENTTDKLANGNLQEKVPIPESKFSKNEITSTLNSLEKMRLALLEEQNRKNKFFMGISHDLRTPVSIIKGYTEAISDGVITKKEDLRETISLIQNKANQLEDMINTLINFMKMNSSQIRQKLLPHSITEIIRNFAKDAALTAPVFKRTVNTDIDLPENIEVPLDCQLVQRAFENLFSNALRYTNDGDKIDITSFYDDKNIYLEIKDSGIGIEQKDLKYIFDMFYRGTNSRQEEGMGIGLSVVKNIIDTHGWKIDVKSKKGVGTAFKITIPYADQEKDSQTDNSEEKETSKKTSEGQ